MDNHRTTAAIAGPIAAGTSRRKLLGYGMIGLSVVLLAGCVYREPGMGNDRGRSDGGRDSHWQDPDRNREQDQRREQDRDRDEHRDQDQRRDQDRDNDWNRR